MAEVDRLIIGGRQQHDDAARQRRAASRDRPADDDLARPARVALRLYRAGVAATRTARRIHREPRGAANEIEVRVTLYS